MRPAPASFVVCLAELLGAETATLPISHDGDPVLQAREWLAGRGLGLIPVREPADFGWGGRWLAVLADGRCALAFGAPPGLVFGPQDVDAAAPEIIGGWVLAPLRTPSLTDLPPAPAVTGTVAALLVAPRATAAMERIDVAQAHAGRGLEGDRYFAAAGTFSDPAGTGHDLTLVEAEALDALGVTPEEARRNVVTRGIDLDQLVGRRFRIGDVECLGRRRCEPCAHLERLTAPGALRALVHRGGLRADVLTSGQITVGATVRSVD